MSSSRIGNFGAEQLYISQLLNTNTRIQSEQSQVTTGLKSTSYSGIASDADSALNLQVQQAAANQYVSDNSLTNTKLTAASTSLDSVQTTINNLLDQLNLYSEGTTKNTVEVQSLQTQAFNALTAMQSYLGVSVAGQYLFSGGRVSDNPVVLPAQNLQDFQAMYNGVTTTFPTTRAADLADFSLTPQQTGAVTFDSSNGLIIPANAGGFSTVPSGAYVQVGNTQSNNGSLTITGHAATSTGGTMLAETSNIGNAAVITYDGGTKTLDNAATGNLSLSFDKSGQIVVTPQTIGSLAKLTVGSSFTVTGSSSNVTTASATDTTPMVGTNLYTYSSGSTAPTGLTFRSGDTLTVTDSTQSKSYTFTVSNSASLKDLTAWLSSVPNMSAGVDNQGRLSVATATTTSDTISLGGSLAGMLGFQSTGPVTTTPVTSGPILDSVNAQTLTSLQPAVTVPASAPIASGDTLVFNGAATLTVTPTTTLTDLTQWIQQQDPKATVAFNGGQLSIANGNGAGGTAYTLTGSLVAKLGLGTAPDTIAAGASQTGAALPVVPGSYDGAYTVVGVSSDGSVTIANDTAQTANERVSAASVGLAAGMPPSAVATGLGSGDAFISVSGSTVTLTLPPGGTDLTTKFAAGSPVTLSGTASHNGTFTVSGVTANTVSFQINPDALRVSQFVPQTGRTDVTLSFATSEPDTQPQPAGSATTNPVPGTVSGGVAQLDPSVYGTLSFSPNPGGGEKISAGIPGSLTTTLGQPYPPPGAVLTLKSTAGVNDGSYTVVSNDGTNVVVQATTLKAESGSAAATMSATSWYKGDTLSTRQNVDLNQQINVGMFASDPAFEKAMRAMALLAQGAAGTAGSLENHPDRIAAAQYLLQNAVSTPPDGTPPYGPEEAGTVMQLTENLGYTQSVIKTANDKHDSYIGFIQTRLADITRADQTEAITTLLADSNALQASYQALARVSQLSLLNYLPAP